MNAKGAPRLDEDPYIWLEDVHGEKPLAWVREQNARTTAILKADPRYQEDYQTALAMLDATDRIPYGSLDHGFVFNFWQDAEHPKGIWRRTAVASYENATPDWDVLLDLDALAAKEGEDWTWSGAATIRETHDRAIVMVSRGGADAVVLREFDLPSRDFVPDGFALPEAKGGAAWVDRDTLLLSSALGEGMATSSGYARAVRPGSCRVRRFRSRLFAGPTVAGARRALRAAFLRWLVRQSAHQLGRPRKHAAKPRSGSRAHRPPRRRPLQGLPGGGPLALPPPAHRGNR